MNLVKLNWLHPKVRPNGPNDILLWDNLIHSEDLDVLVNSELKSNIFIIKNTLNEYIEIEQLNLIVRVKESCLTNIN